MQFVAENVEEDDSTIIMMEGNPPVFGPLVC
jgi:hypothetical protein